MSALADDLREAEYLLERAADQAMWTYHPDVLARLGELRAEVAALIDALPVYATTIRENRADRSYWHRPR